MNEYLMYHLWQQREERMPQELEQHRVVEERMLEQQREQQLASAPVAEALALAQPNADDYVLVDE